MSRQEMNAKNVRKLALRTGLPIVAVSVRGGEDHAKHLFLEGGVVEIMRKDGSHYRANFSWQPVRRYMMNLPKDPPPGLLMSMALRYDHRLGCDGYYDMFGAGEHEKRLRGTLVAMRQIYEEVSGNGFYRPEREAFYAAMLPPNARNQPDKPR